MYLCLWIKVTRHETESTLYVFVCVCVFCVAAKEKKGRKKKKKNEEERVTMNSERLTQAVIKLQLEVAGTTIRQTGGLCRQVAQ